MRPPKVYTQEEWRAAVLPLKNGEIPMAEAAKRLGMSTSTFKVHYRRNEGTDPPTWCGRRAYITPEFCRIYRAYRSGRISRKTAAQRMGISLDALRARLRGYEQLLARSPLPDGWDQVIRQVEMLQMTHTAAAEALGITPAELRRMYWERNGERLPRIWYVLKGWRASA